VQRGDDSLLHQQSYDFEVYSAAQQKWLEVSSVSNFESFQTNRMKIRFKDDSGKTQLLHSLNGSSLALPRIGLPVREQPANRFYFTAGGAAFLLQSQKP
jgi:seryl-tRNA synthetase